MSLSQFVDLVKSALPEDVAFDTLRKYASQDMWQEMPYEAACTALRDCPRFNWGAYLERNADVKEAHVDPCQHYIKNGVYEGRKLLSWHSLKQPEMPDSPVVSIVLANYNKGHFLGRSLESVLSQTLANIEIIVVDDCSTDDSQNIINEYAANDKRIKIIFNDRNIGSMLTRKRGAEAATGRYLMFLNSGDYIVPKTCEIAAKSIGLGYDMVKFDFRIISALTMDEKGLEGAVTDGNENWENFYGEILSVLFVERKINWSIWSGIYLREIVVTAFAELPDEYFVGFDDILAMIAIARLTRSLLKISNILYIHKMSDPISLSNYKYKILNRLLEKCKTVRFIREYSLRHSININVNRLYTDLCDLIIKDMIEFSFEKEVFRNFWIVYDLLGFDSVMKVLVQRHACEAYKILEMSKQIIEEKQIKHIGLFYPVLGPGGVETVIQTISTILNGGEYRISIFTEEKSEHDLVFPPWVDIIYITPPYQGESNLLERMQGFERAVVNSGIDVMLHASTWRPHIVWDVLVLHQHNIPVIITWHSTFGFPLIGHFGQDLQSLERVFRCADAVTCLSTVDELYLRQRGVNAMYLANPVKQVPYEIRSEIPAKIAVVGRFGADEKQVGQSLRVLREVVTQAPWLTMVLIGDFYTEEQRREYRRRIKEYGIEDSITLTGWVKDTNYFLRQCGVLLSVSYWEAFPMGIAEAQALGLPCVIYDLEIEQAKNNESIIKVPQGDFRAAAAELIRLFNDSDEWRRLSAIAVENAKKYSPDIFAINLKRLLDNFQLSMPIRVYSCDDYRILAKNLSFYSRHKAPTVWD